LSQGLDPDDRVVILRPSDDADRGEEALNEVREILFQVAPDLELLVEKLPHTDFVNTTLSCGSLLQGMEGETIVVLGGGAREILLPLTLATFTNEHYVDTVLQMGDIDGTVRRLPLLNLRGNVSDAEESMLANLAELTEEASITEIAERFDKSKSTVTRHVQSLESAGFVETSKRGKSKVVSLTDSGRVFLSGRVERVI
jgi:CRISPR-associated protein Csa3